MEFHLSSVESSIIDLLRLKVFFLSFSENI